MTVHWNTHLTFMTKYSIGAGEKRFSPLRHPLSWKGFLKDGLNVPIHRHGVLYAATWIPYSLERVITFVVVLAGCWPHTRWS